jgi:hypothetical protein
VVYPAVAIQALVQAQQAVLHRADQFAALF